VVVVTVIIVKFLLGGSKKPQRPKALVEPTVKYPLKLVDKVVSYAQSSLTNSL